MTAELVAQLRELADRAGTIDWYERSARQALRSAADTLAENATEIESLSRAFNDLNDGCVELEKELAAATAEAKRLREAITGLLSNVKMHQDGSCPGITPADCLDAIYEACNIARAALEAKP